MVIVNVVVLCRQEGSPLTYRVFVGQSPALPAPWYLHHYYGQLPLSLAQDAPEKLSPVLPVQEVEISRTTPGQQLIRASKKAKRGMKYVCE